LNDITQENFMEINPYLAPESSLENVPEVAEQASDKRLSETELAAFAGGTVYPPLMYRFIYGKTKTAGFNIWAALFGIQWFFFRKLYLAGLCSFVLEFAIPYGGFALLRSFSEHITDDTRVLALILLILVTRVAIGYMANIALSLKAASVIDDVDKLNKDNATHLRLITEAGKVSVPSLLFIYLVTGIIRAFY
jgi:hypothetical protein